MCFLFLFGNVASVTLFGTCSDYSRHSEDHVQGPNGVTLFIFIINLLVYDV